MGRRANSRGGQGPLKKGKYSSIKNGGGACGGCSEDLNECMRRPSLGLGHSSGMMDGTLDWPFSRTRTVSQKTPSATPVWLGSSIKGTVSTQQQRKPEPHGQRGRPFLRGLELRVEAWIQGVYFLGYQQCAFWQGTLP